VHVKLKTVEEKEKEAIYNKGYGDLKEIIAHRIGKK
jgi:hypothetical protein